MFMKKIKYIILVLAFISMFCLVGCNKNVIEAPNNVSIDEENIMTWDSVSEAKSYNVKIYDVRNNDNIIQSTRKTKFDLNTLSEGDYEICVQSTSGDSKKKDSEFTDVIYFQKFFETGCVYSLINNNTEYEIKKVGKASGEFAIEKIYRGKAVTRIADGAFKGSTRVTNITIGENVSSLGENAFYNCAKLQAIVIPSSVREIGKACFQSCKALKEVVIPNSITTLDEFTFAYCRQLEKVVLSNELTFIGESCFQDCSALKEILITDSVETVSKYAFSGCTSLEKVSVGKGVKELSERVFYKCTSLEDISFSEESTLESIGESCFQDCINLVDATLPKGVVSISDYAFYGCEKLETIKIPQTTTTVGTGCFYRSKLYVDAINNGDSFVYADNWLVGASQEKLAELVKIDQYTLKDTIVGIADNVFRGCPLLEEVELPASFKYIGNYAFYNCVNLWKLKTLDDSIEIIGNSAFANCRLLNVILGVGLKRIGSFAFYGNTQLDNNSNIPTSWIPQSVTSVGKDAFKNTKLYNNPKFDDGIVYASNWVVGYTSSNLGSVTLQLDTKKVAGIADYAFKDCTTLQSIQGLANCRYVGNGAFYGCENLASVSLNRNLTEIRAYTFYKCSSLFKVSFPMTLESIGDYAFLKCSLLDEIDLSSTECKSIGNSVFHSDFNLKTVKLSTELESIGNYAFYRCTSLESIEFKKNVKNIGIKVFYKNTSLASVTLNEGLEEIPESTFYGCEVLTSIEVPSTVEKIGRYAFYKCANIKSVTLKEGLKQIGDYSFYGLEKVTSLNLPSTLDSIGNYAFKGLVGLTTIVIPNTIRELGQHCFYGCKNMTIYTNASSILGEWHNRFNSSYRPIFWDCEFDENNNVKSVNIKSEMFENKNASNGVNPPTVDGKTFKCWIDEESNTYSMDDLLNIEKEGRLEAVYE